MELRLDDNLLERDWIDGSSGSTSKYTIFGILPTGTTINSRENDLDPFNETTTIWQVSGNTDVELYYTSGISGYTSGGFTSYLLDIDNTKTYRLSVWINVVTTGITAPTYTSGNNVHLGVKSYNSSETLTGLTRITNNTLASTSYGITKTNSTMLQNNWMLYTYYIRPYTWTGKTVTSSAGVYLNGTETTGNSYEWRFNINVAKISMLIYAPYCGGRRNISRIAYPRIDLVDGTEPSISELLSGITYKLNSGGTYYDVGAVKIKQNDTWYDVKNIKLKKDNNLLDYSDWSDYPGPPGPPNYFIAYENTLGTNIRTNGTDPFNITAVVWRTLATAIQTGYRAGWNNTRTDSNIIPIDITKNYRHSVWVKRNSTSAPLRMGPLGYNSSKSPVDFIRVDTNNTIRDGSQIIATVPSGNTWFLLVSYIFNYQYSPGSIQQTAYYDVNGNNLGKGTGIGDLKFENRGTWDSRRCAYILNRLYAPYGGSIESSFDLIYPRMDIVDGTEPSITTLLTSEGVWLNAKTFNKNEGDW